jgi:hypothetical protein
MWWRLDKTTNTLPNRFSGSNGKEGKLRSEANGTSLSEIANVILASAYLEVWLVECESYIF